jgi:hypothetical protein
LAKGKKTPFLTSFFLLALGKNGKRENSSEKRKQQRVQPVYRAEWFPVVFKVLSF